MTENKGSKENLPAEASSPKTFTKKEKTKYQAFRSDEEESSEGEEPDDNGKARRKIKSQRSNTFKVKIKKKGKKKDKDKEKEKDKEKKKKAKKSVTSGDEAGDTNNASLHGPVFGVPLEVAVERTAFPDKIELPRIVRESILYVEEKGLDMEGIYRISGVKSKVDSLKQLYNEGGKVDLSDYDPNNVASLLKLYLRELPSNVLTTRLAPIFDSCIGLDDTKEQIRRFQQLIHDLPCPNKTLLAWLFTHFSHIMDNNSETKMNIQNLSIVLSPTMSISHGVLNIFFTHTKELFPDTKLVPYVVVPEEAKEVAIPETVEGLQKILEENETILSKLHEKVNQVGDEDESLMDKLWEHQRRSTQIKRKLKTLKKKMEQFDTVTDESKGDSKTEIAGTQENIPTEEKKVTHVDNSTSQPIKLKDLVKADVVKKDVPLVEMTKTDNSIPQKTKSKQKKARKPETWKAEIVVTKTVRKSNETSKRLSESGINETEPSKKIEIDENLVNGVGTEKVEDTHDTDTDEEYQTLILEEQLLLIQNEELLKVGKLLKRKIQREQDEVDQLKASLQEYQNTKDVTLSSSSSSSRSSSSRNSSCFDESETSESEEDTSELELILAEQEKQNRELMTQGDTLIANISAERHKCAMLQSEIRFLEMKMLSV